MIQNRNAWEYKYAPACEIHLNSRIIPCVFFGMYVQCDPWQIINFWYLWFRISYLGPRTCLLYVKYAILDRKKCRKKSLNHHKNAKENSNERWIVVIFIAAKPWNKNVTESNRKALLFWSWIEKCVCVCVMFTLAMFYAFKQSVILYCTSSFLHSCLVLVIKRNRFAIIYTILTYTHQEMCVLRHIFYLNMANEEQSHSAHLMSLKSAFILVVVVGLVLVCRLHCTLATFLFFFKSPTGWPCAKAYSFELWGCVSAIFMTKEEKHKYNSIILATQQFLFIYLYKKIYGKSKTTKMCYSLQSLQCRHTYTARPIHDFSTMCISSVHVLFLMHVSNCFFWKRSSPRRACAETTWIIF